MANEINSFLQAFSRDTKYFLSHPFLWKVNIESNVTGAVNQALSKGGEFWRASQIPDSYSKNGDILVATEVSIPSEQSSFSDFGQENRGGFLPGYGIVQRESFLTRNITVNFLETDIDLEHTFFRPWTIALGIDGLINQGLKSTISLTQYDNRLRRRKGYVFEDAFPTICEGYGLTRGPGEYIQKTVTFACKNYRQT